MKLEVDAVVVEIGYDPCYDKMLAGDNLVAVSGTPYVDVATGWNHETVRFKRPAWEPYLGQRLKLTIEPIE